MGDDSIGFRNWSEAPRPQGGASRKGNLIYIVPLDPAYKAGLAGHLPVKADHIKELSLIRKPPCG